MPASKSVTELTQVAARAIAEKLGTDMIALDLSDQLVLSEVFLIATGGNVRQVDSIADEIEKEMVKYGIVSASPRVFQIENGSGWDRVSTGNYDIAVACTQSIWEGDKRILSREDLAKKLSMFEAIVVDECQFAPERFLELIDMAPRAWKFSMSATPMDGDGKFLAQDHPGRFVLLSSYSYIDGRDDKILKEVKRYQ